MLNGMIDFISLMDAVQDLTPAEIADWLLKVIESGTTGNVNEIYTASYGYKSLSESRKKLKQYAAEKMAVEKINNKKNKTVDSATDLIIGLKDGFCYLMKDDRGRYKIGISQDPVERVKQLTHDKERRIDLIHFYFTFSPKDEEKRLHQLFWDKRIMGEWFALEPNDVEMICSLRDKASLPKYRNRAAEKAREILVHE